MGVSGLTHRRVAARAEVPLGATTYYFRTLDDLVAAALGQATADSVRELHQLAGALDTTADLPDTLASLTAAYVRQSPRTRVEMELYLAAAHRPELRPLARTWIDGVTAILRDRVGVAAAQAAAMFVDGAVLHALIRDEPLDAQALCHSLAALLDALGDCGAPGG